jgi:UDP-N-acetylglucosamine 2-epimerase (non-hydrolysing)
MTHARRILHVVGARPNFMKIAPVLREMERRDVADHVLLHSGQHYDDDMSDAFFRDLGIRRPDIHLGVGSATHGKQTAEVLARTEQVLLDGRWDMVIVVGDVNSTVAAALAAAKLGIAVAHVEAGLRSRDRAMPEELNRIVTDQLSDLLLTPSRDADENLAAEGISAARIRFVGNVMIDTLLHTLDQVRAEPHPFPDLEPGGYGVVTLHRPSNVDDAAQLREITGALEEIARELPLVFPVHPRTAKAMQAAGIALDRIRTVPPVGYREMLALQADAGIVLTDSGGIQEETTVLGVPCLTLRSTTERPITIEQGTNRLVPVRSRESILAAFAEHREAGVEARRPEGWDGRASERIADAVAEVLEGSG